MGRSSAPGWAMPQKWMKLAELLLFLFPIFVSLRPFALSFNHHYTAPDIAPVSQ
jgi:hypothetical protein